MVKLICEQPIATTVKRLSVVLFAYVLLWTVFFYKSGIASNNLGGNVCFDDWCATVLAYDKVEKIGSQKASGQFVVLTISMTNKARGIAQKPSEPRVYLLDGQGHRWGVSAAGQDALEKAAGHQIPLGQKLDLNQSLQTKLIFDVPQTATNLKAVIEEGPFITKLLLKSDRQGFELK